MIKEEVMKLIKAIIDTGLTDEHIGAATGYTVSSVRAWRLGHRVPKLPVVVMLENILKKTERIQKPL